MKTLERISQHSFLPALVRKESTVLDLGGNRGAFSTGVARRYGWRTVAVEPTPALASYLRGCGVEVLEVAVTDQDGSTTFTFDPSHELTGSVLGTEVVGAIMSDERARDTITVPTVSLATLLKAHGPVDLVKVDIEGAELDMLLTADDDALLSVRQFTVEFHDFWYSSLAERTEAAKSRLLSLGFWMLRSGPNNKDVLFIHPDHRPGPVAAFYIGFWLRNLNGLWRMLRVFLTRLLSQRPPPSTSTPAATHSAA